MKAARHSRAVKKSPSKPLKQGDRVLHDGTAYAYIATGADGIALLQRADGKRPSFETAPHSELVRV